MLRVDERVEVSVDRVGEPIGFWWRGAGYLVKSKPIRWFARREWWIEAARVQRGIGAGVLEVEMWRMSASSNNKDKAQYELVHTLDTSGGQKHIWRLVRVYD
ncbi:MAG: hypothetical protein RLZZ594_356 [Actinomycetota bacterium]|jgi:hypothetical protein